MRETKLVNVGYTRIIIVMGGRNTYIVRESGLQLRKVV